MPNRPSLSRLDRMICRADRLLQTLLLPQASHQHPPDPIPSPSATLNTDLAPHMRSISAALMRVNHCGEICAQGLYHGQALTAQTPEVKAFLLHAAAEEQQHLDWCAQRLIELDSHTSYLNHFWYWSAFIIGVSNGLLGDRWSLGFIVETEKQVGQHLARHLTRLPSTDLRSQHIIQQMCQDEAKHAYLAKEQGGAVLPVWFKLGMALTAKVMTGTAYYI